MSKELRAQAAKLLAMMDAEYESQNPSDPHAENKALYAKDAAVHKEPWKLWEYATPQLDWQKCYTTPEWHIYNEYRRIQTKQLVDWSCPLLKGCNTNYGELHKLGITEITWLIEEAEQWQRFESIRLAHTDATPSNWQAYNGEDLSLLHEAGFVVEARFNYVDVIGHIKQEVKNYGDPIKMIPRYTTAYRVIGIRDGFTDNPNEAV